MDIGGVLSRAWQIVWKYKVLWIFGILASCSGGGGSGSGSSGSRYEYGSNELPASVQNFFNQYANMPSWQVAGIIALIVLVFLLLIALLVFLGTMGRIGLIRGTQQAEAGAERMTFGELFRGGLPYFWRVFLLNLLVGIIVALVIAAVVAFFILATVATLGTLLLCLIPFICVLIIAFIVIAWLINAVIEQANNAIVLENLRIMAGLRRGWDLVRDNLGVMIVMGLILFLGVQGIIGFLLGLPLFVIAIPAIIGATSNTTQGLWAGLVVAGLCLIAYLPVYIILYGILRAYVGTAWTLTFMRLSGKPATSPEPMPEQLPEITI